MDLLEAVLAIVLIDLALSGDNALVIGMAARGLPSRQRRAAIVFGGLGAVLLRVLATSIVSLLLRVPLLQLAGGLILVLIAYRLVRPRPDAPLSVRAAVSLREAIVTILLADAVMSLENVLGVAGAAHGNVPLLAFGLALSIPIVLFGSGIIATVLERLPRLVWLGAFALVWTAADLILDDPMVDLGALLPWINEGLLAGALLALILLARQAPRVRALALLPAQKRGGDADSPL